MTSSPTTIDARTKKDDSLFFRMAIIPKIKAAIFAENRIGTVTSHQRSPKERTLNPSTKSTETATTIKNQKFSQTDHFPNFVCGFSSISK